METSSAELFRTVSLRLIRAQERLRGFILGVTMDFNSVDDILSETNQWILEHAETYDPARPFEAWAVAAAKWQIRRAATDAQREAKFLTVDSSLVDSLEEAFLEDSGRDPISTAAVVQGMEKLGPVNRDLMYLKYVEGRNVSEIARLRGLSEAAVYSQLARARRSLREQVARIVEDMKGGKSG